MKNKKAIVITSILLVFAIIMTLAVAIIIQFTKRDKRDFAAPDECIAVVDDIESSLNQGYSKLYQLWPEEYLNLCDELDIDFEKQIADRLYDTGLEKIKTVKEIKIVKCPLLDEDELWQTNIQQDMYNEIAKQMNSKITMSPVSAGSNVFTEIKYQTESGEEASISVVFRIVKVNNHWFLDAINVEGVL